MIKTTVLEFLCQLESGMIDDFG